MVGWVGQIQFYNPLWLSSDHRLDSESMFEPSGVSQNIKDDIILDIFNRCFYFFWRVLLSCVFGEKIVANQISRMKIDQDFPTLHTDWTIIILKMYECKAQQPLVPNLDQLFILRSKTLQQPWTMSNTITFDWAWLLCENHWPFHRKNQVSLIHRMFFKNFSIWPILILEIWLATYFSLYTRVNRSINGAWQLDFYRRLIQTK